MIAVQLLGCSADDGLPVVARGRYVEIATERVEPVCGGTAAYMDRIIEAAFAVMDEGPPPDRRFVRFEWLEVDEEDPVIGGGRTTFTDDGVLIRSDAYLVEEHELVHAAQHEVWPPSNSFLHEGHAILLDAKRLWRDPSPWPETASLDDLLGADKVAHDDYALAWFVVSQVVLDHGFDGLRDLWHAVPSGSTAAEVREAYEMLFGRSIDALVQPYIVEYPDPIGPTEIERLPCNFALCPAVDATPWRGEVWTAAAPADCEDDPNAIGPDHRIYLDEGDVWLDYSVSLEPGEYYSDSRSDRIASTTFGCALDCTYEGAGAWSGAPGSSTPPILNFSMSPKRVEVRASLSDLPTTSTGALEIVHEPPP